MTRRTLLIVAGIALMVGLYLYDRDNRTETVEAATVIALEDRDTEAGPDSWHLTVEINGTEAELAELEKRPVVEAGDRICVTRIRRSGQPDELRYAPSASC